MKNTNESELRELMTKAASLRSKGMGQQAVAALHPFARILRSFAPGAGLMATLYWEMNDFRRSAKWFAIAAKAAPHSEHASLGVFHSLWELGKYDEAFDEMRRFLTLENSAEYGRILRELSTTISNLPLEDRWDINAAEHAGLEWRISRKLTPLTSLELQHA